MLEFVPLFLRRLLYRMGYGGGELYSTCFWQQRKLKALSSKSNDGEMEMTMTAYQVMRFRALEIDETFYALLRSTFESDEITLKCVQMTYAPI